MRFLLLLSLVLQLNISGFANHNTQENHVIETLNSENTFSDERSYNRFRYYDPDERMSLSQDPIRLNAGISLYSYVKDTNGWVDVLALVGIPLDDALQKACDFMQPNVSQYIMENSSGIQVIQQFQNTNDNTITKRVGIDINPNSSHVQNLGPHLNLQTQIDGKVVTSGALADPHIPIDASTIKPKDVCH